MCVKDVLAIGSFGAIKVHFDEAAGLGAPEVRALDGEVEPGALGRKLQPPMLGVWVIVACRQTIHVFADTGVGIPHHVHFNEAAQGKFRGGHGQRGHQQGQYYPKNYKLFHCSPL